MIASHCSTRRQAATQKSTTSLLGLTSTLCSRRTKRMTHPYSKKQTSSPCTRSGTSASSPGSLLSLVIVTTAAIPRPARSTRRRSGHDQLWNTYTEVSPSGTGLRFMGHGEAPDAKGRNTTVNGCKREFYSEGHWLTITGNVLPGHEEIRRMEPGEVKKIYDAHTKGNKKQSTV